MNKTVYFNQLVDNCQKGIALMKDKNHDYAGEDDPFKNFRSAEALGLTVEQGILLRMQDKMSRASTLCQKGMVAKVTTEKVEDTLMDLMNYANILLVYIQVQRGIVQDKLPDLHQMQWGEPHPIQLCNTNCVHE